MAAFIVVALFIAIVALFITRFESSGGSRKKISGRGGDFES